MKKTKGYILTIIGGCLWGFSGCCGQYLFLNKEVTSQLLVPFRLTIAGALILIYYAFTKGAKVFSVFGSKRDIFDIVIFGLFGMMACQFTYFYAIEYSNAATATVLQYTNPVLIMITACIIAKKLPRLYEVISIILAVTGTFLIATHGSLTTLAVSPRALAVGLLSACTCIVYSMQPKRLLSRYETPYVLGWGMFIGGVVLMAVFRPWRYSFIADAAAFTAFGAIVIFGSICAFSFYLMGVKELGAVKASLFACVEPVASAVISAVWMKTSFTVQDIIGFSLIISTLFLLGFGDMKTKT